MCVPGYDDLERLSQGAAGGGRDSEGAKRGGRGHKQLSEVSSNPVSVSQLYKDLYSAGVHLAWGWAQSQGTQAATRLLTMFRESLEVLKHSGLPHLDEYRKDLGRPNMQQWEALRCAAVVEAQWRECLGAPMTALSKAIGTAGEEAEEALVAAINDALGRAYVAGLDDGRAVAVAEGMLSVPLGSRG